MALIICPECNDTRISDTAAQCPKCGCGMDVIQKMLAEKEANFQKRKKELEEMEFVYAEDAWESYAAAIAEAAEKYNTRYAEIESRYASIAEQYEQELAAFAEDVKASEAKVDEIDSRIRSLGLFKSKERNKLMSEISAIKRDIVARKDEIEASSDETKEKCNREIDEIADILRAENEKQSEAIESEWGLTVSSCESAYGVFREELLNGRFIGYWIKDMLEIKGPMTLDEITKNMPFAQVNRYTDRQNRALEHYMKKGVKELLADKDRLRKEGIGQKQFYDDFYFIALTDSAVDMNKLEEERAKNMRMEELRDMNRIQVRENYNTASSKSSDKHASVIKRGIAGAVIAGPAGAIIGGMSAINENLKKSNETTEKR